MSYTREDNGKLSSNRLVFLIGMGASLIIPTTFTILYHWSAGEFIGSFSAISAVFATMKVAQKPLESKDLKK